MKNIYKAVNESLVLDIPQDVSVKFTRKKITNDIDMSAYYVRCLLDGKDAEYEYYYNELVKFPTGKYKVKDYRELKSIIMTLCKHVTQEPDLNWISLLNIRSLKYLFSPYYDENMEFKNEPDGELEFFNGDISKWNTSEITDMSYMFKGCKHFNQALYFDTRNVRDMSYMFFGCEQFDQKLNFDMSHVKKDKDMFKHCGVSKND